MLMKSACDAAAQAELERQEAEAERANRAEERAALLDEVVRFMRNHPEVEITPPWDRPGGGELWQVDIAGNRAAYDNPEFMLSQLAERFGFTDDKF